MEKVNSIAAVKKVYTIFSDEETRGFCASLRRLAKDCADAEAAQRFADAEAAAKAEADAAKAAKKRAEDLKRAAAKNESKAAEAAEAEAAAKEAAAKEAEAKKEAQKAQQKAAEAKKRSAASEKAAKALQALADIMQRKGLRAEDITKEYLLQWLPLRFNSLQQICSVKRVEVEEEAKAREDWKEFPAALLEREDRLFLYRPILLFTSNTFFSLFCSAADAKKKAEKEVLSAAEKEAKQREAAEKEARRIEAYRAKIAAYEAKQAQKQQEAQK